MQEQGEFPSRGDHSRETAGKEHAKEGKKTSLFLGRENRKKGEGGGPKKT